jgi:G3E family GTPase
MKDKRRLVLRAGENSADPGQIAEQIKAVAEEGTTDQLIIECDPEVPAMAYASLILPLSKIARLATTALVINPSSLLDALVHREAVANLVSPCFIAEQLEFVGNIIFEGHSNDADFKLARAVVISLNPRAQVSELSSEIVARLLNDTGTSFDFTAALDGAGWRTLIDAGETGTRPANITAFGYHARRPFHPEKFWNLLQGGLPAVFRAKGFFWLASRMDLVGGLNFAGSESHFAPAGEWWAVRDAHAREVEMPERTKKEWKEPFGDRRQAIAFMGLDFDQHAFKKQLDACLLTDSEMAGGEKSWHALADPFPSWSGHAHEHQCDHGHDSDGHECCHH